MSQNNLKRKRDETSEGTVPLKKKKFNPPKFSNLPSTQASTTTTSTISTSKPNGAKPHPILSQRTVNSQSTQNAPPKKPKFKALVPIKGNARSNQKNANSNSTSSSKKSKPGDDGSNSSKPLIGDKRVIVASRKQTKKFVPPKIVDHEKAKANMKVYIEDLASAYGHALGSIGIRRERATLPVHDPDDENALILWDPELEGEDSESEPSDDDDDDDGDSDADQDNEADAEEEDKAEEKTKPTRIGVKNALALKAKKASKKRHQVAIVVDPRLSSKLRQHQREGVQFVYRCMMDPIYAPDNEYGEGCILADGMGLGKTLQAIAVMWTLMEQDVFAGQQTCTNGMVLCPASLVANWDNEIAQWLHGGKRMKTFPCLKKTKDVIGQFLNQCRAPNCAQIRPLLIISYESFRAYHEQICYKGKPPKANGKIVDNEVAQNMKRDIGFVVCDEGHRLKNYKTELSIAVARIKSRKRLLLSGTPIQNDLKEMYSLANFVNPGVWSNVNEFSRDACKIYRHFDSAAKAKEKEKESDKKSKHKNKKSKDSGEEALSSVRSILEKFMLQRTSKVVMKYLPKKSEYVVFCKLQPLQEVLYESFLASKSVRKMRRQMSAGDSEKSGLDAQGLTACGVLGKICNHPSLVYEECAKIANARSAQFRSAWKLVSAASKAAKTRKKPSKKKSSKKAASECTSAEYDADGNRIKTEFTGLYEKFPANFLQTYLEPQHSSKMAFTLSLLSQLKQNRTGDKTVIVSSYGETLDILEMVLDRIKIQSKRLDGSIATNKRQVIVDEFNDARTPYLVLLLSNRAGGCGLNLIGANRLIMFDADWNPANDAQAMARVWRSGQKKETYIYRLFSTGTLEEKIFQRQTFKSDLAEQLVAQKEDMTDITEFAVKELKKIFVYNKETDCDTMQRTNAQGYNTWDKHKFFDNVGDSYLSRASKVGKVSFLFKRIVNDPNQRKNEKQDDEDETRSMHDDVEECKEEESPEPSSNSRNNPRRSPRRSSASSCSSSASSAKSTSSKKSKTSTASNDVQELKISNGKPAPAAAAAEEESDESEVSPLIKKKKRKRQLAPTKQNQELMDLCSDSD